MNIPQSIMLTAIVVAVFCMFYGGQSFQYKGKTTVTKDGKTETLESTSIRWEAQDWAAIGLALSVLVILADALWMIWAGGGR